VIFHHCFLVEFSRCHFPEYYEMITVKLSVVMGMLWGSPAKRYLIPRKRDEEHGVLWEMESVSIRGYRFRGAF
jgi:hypothetical protein